MDEENLEEQEQNEPKELGDVLFGLKRKFDDFWYHHKVVFIVGVVFLIFLVLAVAQWLMKVESDVEIAYIGAAEINFENHAALLDSLNDLLGEDFNGDEKIYVDFKQFKYMTDMQMETAKAKNQAVDIRAVMNAQTQIDLMLIEGNIVLYLIDYEVYKVLSKRADVFFMPLDDVLGYTPDFSNDEYSIKLGSLPCWKHYMGIDIFPANTVIAMRETPLSEANDKKMQERYRRNRVMFKNLVNIGTGDE